MLRSVREGLFAITAIASAVYICDLANEKKKKIHPIIKK